QDDGFFRSIRETENPEMSEAAGKTGLGHFAYIGCRRHERAGTFIIIGASGLMVQQHLVILLVKLAVAASLASILTRSGRFQRMLMREERTLLQRVQMALVCSFIFATGVAARLLGPEAYQALDLGLEGSLAMGMLGGYVTGLLSGVLIS